MKILYVFCDRYDNKDECLRNANIVKTFAGRFGIGQWSFIGPGSDLTWVGDCKINFWDLLHRSPHVFNPRVGDVDPLPDFVDLLTDAMVDFV